MACQSLGTHWCWQRLSLAGEEVLLRAEAEVLSISRYLSNKEGSPQTAVTLLGTRHWKQELLLSALVMLEQR